MLNVFGQTATFWQIIIIIIIIIKTLYVVESNDAGGGIYCLLLYLKKKVKLSRYRSGVAQRVGRGIALLFDDHGARRG